MWNDPKLDRTRLHELLTTNKSLVANTIDNKSKAVVESGAGGGNESAPRIAYNVAEWTDKQPMELPKGQRAGILTQPSWPVAHPTHFDNHAILRTDELVKPVDATGEVALTGDAKLDGNEPRPQGETGRSRRAESVSDGQRPRSKTATQ